MYCQTSNIRHLSGQNSCWLLRCSWSIACWHCSNYIFIIYLTPGFNGLGKDNCKTRWETFKFWYLVHLILEILHEISCHSISHPHIWAVVCKLWVFGGKLTIITGAHFNTPIFHVSQMPYTYIPHEKTCTSMSLCELHILKDLWWYD